MRYPQVVLRKMASIQIEEERFKITKEAFLRELDNHVQQSPLQQAGSEISWMSSQFGHTDEEERKILVAVTAKDVQEFIPKLLSKFYVEGLGHGNLHKSDIYECCNMFEEILGFERLTREVLLNPRTRVLPDKCNYVVQMSSTNKEEVNSGIIYWTHIGHISQEDLWTRLLMLSRLIREPCFDQLRTQEQLGYIVGSVSLVFCDSSALPLPSLAMPAISSVSPPPPLRLPHDRALATRPLLWASRSRSRANATLSTSRSASMPFSTVMQRV